MVVGTEVVGTEEAAYTMKFTKVSKYRQVSAFFRPAGTPRAPAGPGLVCLDPGLRLIRASLMIRVMEHRPASCPSLTDDPSH
jgi:hypothetical protein